MNVSSAGWDMELISTYKTKRRHVELKSSMVVKHAAECLTHAG